MLSAQHQVPDEQSQASQEKLPIWFRLPRACHPVSRQDVSTPEAPNCTPVRTPTVPLDVSIR